MFYAFNVGRAPSLGVGSDGAVLYRPEGETDAGFDGEHVCLGCGRSHASGTEREYVVRQLGSGDLDAWHMRDAHVRHCPGKIIAATDAFRASATMFADTQQTSALGEFYFECHKGDLVTDDHGASIKVCSQLSGGT